MPANATKRHAFSIYKNLKEDIRTELLYKIPMKYPRKNLGFTLGNTLE